MFDCAYVLCVRNKIIIIIITRDVINPVANEDVRKLRAFLVNQQQFPHWRPHLPVTLRSLPVTMTSLPVDMRTF